MGSDPKTSSDELSLKIKILMLFLKRIVNFWDPKSGLKNTHKSQVDPVSDRSEIPQEQHHSLHHLCKNSTKSCLVLFFFLILSLPDLPKMLRFTWCFITVKDLSISNPSCKHISLKCLLKRTVKLKLNSTDLHHKHKQHLRRLTHQCSLLASVLPLSILFLCAAACTFQLLLSVVEFFIQRPLKSSGAHPIPATGFTSHHSNSALRALIASFQVPNNAVN